MKNGIYQIRNIVNGKLYIGSAAGRGFDNRWKLHLVDLTKDQHHSPKLQNAWNKYGPASFVFEILETCEPSLCLNREQHYLDTLLFASANDGRFNELGYNICRVAGSMKGLKWSEESKRRVSGKNAHMYGKYGRSHHLYGFKHSEESKRSMSKNKKGKMVGEKNPMYGKIKSPETLEKMKLSHLGKKLPIEVCRKMSESRGKLDWTRVGCIRYDISLGMRTIDIAKKYDISASTISNIKANRIWRNK